MNKRTRWDKFCTWYRDLGCLAQFVLMAIAICLLGFGVGLIFNPNGSGDSDAPNFFPSKLEAANADVKYDEQRFDECKDAGDTDGMAKEEAQLQKDRDKVQLLKDNGEK